MHLLAKFNIVLITIFAGALLAVCGFSNATFESNAREQVTQDARIMMETASAMRGYTDKQIKPLLQQQLRHVFLPQSVPAYAATEGFNELRKKYPDYTYKEAALNPTNPRDRATDWETDLIDTFQDHPEQTEIIGERSTPTGESLYLSHPIRITDPACLSCHSTAMAAPHTMLVLYGRDNGFGWKLNQVVGAQIVAVPTSLPEQMARQAFGELLGSLIAIFIVTLIVLNIMLTMMVIRPVMQLSHVADEISKGNVDVDEIPSHGKDEIAGLASSFNRMQRSLKKAMAMLEDN
jgi:HAMP domain-containing protein